MDNVSDDKMVDLVLEKEDIEKRREYLVKRVLYSLHLLDKIQVMEADILNDKYHRLTESSYIQDCHSFGDSKTTQTVSSPGAKSPDHPQHSRHPTSPAGPRAVQSDDLPSTATAIRPGINQEGISGGSGAESSWPQ